MFPYSAIRAPFRALRCERRPVPKGRRIVLASLAAIVCGTLLGSPSRATDLELRGAAWAGGSTGLVKVRATDNVVVLQVPAAGSVTAVAVDPTRRVVWAYAQPNLYSYDFGGNRLTSTSIPGSGTSWQLAVRAFDGSVWLSLGSTLYSVSGGGQLLRTVAGPGVIKELAVESGGGVLWAATAGAVTALDAVSGAKLGSLTDLGSSPKVASISLGSSDLIVALSGSLRVYTTNGTSAPVFRQSLSVSGSLFIAQNNDGMVWVAKTSDVTMVSYPPNVGGAVYISDLGNPFARGETPVAIASDSNSVWIATSTSRVIQENSAAKAYVAIAPTATLRDIAVFPRETVSPTLSLSTSSFYTNDPTAAVTASYGDSGSGVDPSTLNVIRNTSGGMIAFSCSTAANSATCTPTAAYQEGSNTVTGTVKDYAGNYSTSASVTVRLDTQPPAVSITSPAPGAVLTNPNTPFVASYSDSTSLDTSTFRITAEDPAITFSCSVGGSSATCTANGGLPGGTHTITASIRDGAGNVGSASVAVTMPVADTTPPVLSFVGPRANAYVADATPLLRVSYTDVGKGVDPTTLAFTVGGQALPVSCTFDLVSAGCAPTSALPLGSVIVSASVKDMAGNVSNVASLGFNIAAPQIQVKGLVRRADGSSPAGATVFIAGMAAATTVAADGSFSMTVTPVRSGQQLTLGARQLVGSDAYDGGAAFTVSLGGTAADLGTITLQRLCDYGFTDPFLPGDDVPSGGGVIETFETFNDGTGASIYTGGTFDYLSGQYVGGVAKWNGSQWLPLGSSNNAGVNGEVKALAVFDDGTGPALYVAGTFSQAGGVAASNIARWDGHAWSALGQGISNTVFGLEVYDDGSGPALYAMGGFLTAGGVTVNHIARWDGYSWSALGGGTDADPHAMTTFTDSTGTALFLGGGSNAVQQTVWRWDGHSWSYPVSSGDTVFAMAAGAPGTTRGALFFNGFNGTQDALARWDGQTATTIPGSPPYVSSIVVADTGRAPELFVGAGGSVVLLRWDGQSWHGVGGGVGDERSSIRNLTVDATAGYPQSVLVLGEFAQAGGVAMPHLARWAPQCTPPDRKPPTIRVISPVAGTTTAATAVTVAGSVDEQATVTINGQPVALDAQLGFAKGPLSLVEGLNTFTIVAKDTAGNTSSADVRIVKDTVAPTLKFTYPVQGQTLTTALPQLQLSFSDAGGIALATLSVSAGSSSLPVNCNAGLDTIRCVPMAPLPNGSVTLTARVRDLAGNQSTAAQVSVTVSPSSAAGTTTIVGTAALVGGAPAVGAQVAVQGQPAATAVTTGTGSFSIPAVLAQSGKALSVVVRLGSGDSSLVGFAVASSAALGSTTNVGRIDLRPICAASFDTSFVAGFGLDGSYPRKFPDFTDTGYVPEVRALAVFDDGTGPALYVGGTFKQAGGIPANFIAKFDGTHWTTLGSNVRGGGMNGFVQSLAVFNDGTGSALYAGGYFNSVDGQPIVGIAKWSAGKWTGVGGGVAGAVDNSVMAMTVWNGALYVGGNFGTAGSVSARNIARWDGKAWTALGSGLGSSGNAVYALIPYNALSGKGTALFAGGDFTASGSTAMNKVAAWNGTSWSAVGGGLGTATGDPASGFYNVSSFATYSGSLYAGGWFYGAGNGGTIKAQAVARWDGKAWNPVGDIDSTGAEIADPLGVQALLGQSDTSGSFLYAGGRLQSPSVTGTTGVLRWNGSAWSAAPNSPSAMTFGGKALTTFDDPTDGIAAKLYAGGSPQSLVTSNEEVKALSTWDGTAWHAVGSGLGSYGYSAVAFDDGSGPSLYVASGGMVKRMSRATPPAADGYVWSQLPNPFASGTGGSVQTLTVLDDGSGPALYAAGNFTEGPPWQGTSVLRWRSGAWTPLGKGLADSGAVVRSLATYDSPTGRAIVAAGSIPTIDGVVYNNIALWDGASWRALGTGMSGATGVYALAQHDEGTGPELFAAGDFVAAGGEPTGGIARWNGTSWSAVGTNLSGSFRALASFDDGHGRSLFAAGFVSIDGAPAAYQVVRWDGVRWTAAGASFSADVLWLGVVDDGTGPALYATGYFSSAGTSTVNRIARWNGSAWLPVGSNLGSGTVFGLASFDDSTGPALFAAGAFAYDNYGLKSDPGTLASAGEVYYLAKLRRPLQCSGPDTTPPTLAITSPAASAILYTPTPAITLSYSDSGSGVDTSTVQLTANGAALGVACSFGPSSATCTPSTSLPVGTVTLSATIKDGAGNSSAAASVTFTVRPPDTVPPTVAFTNPTPDLVIGTSTPIIALSFRDDASGVDTSTLQVSANGATINVACSWSASTATCTPVAALPQGTVTLTATVRDIAGNVSSPATVSFTVSVGTAAVSFASPTDGQVLATNRPRIVVDYVASSVPGTLSITGDVAFSLNCTLSPTEAVCDSVNPFAEGPSTITASIQDGAGNMSTARVHFTVDTLPPSISFTSPASASTVLKSRPLLRVDYADAGTGIAPASFQILEGNTPLSVGCSYDSTGASCTPTAAMPDGNHSLTATVVDRTGKSSTATATFRIDTSDTTAPTITLNGLASFTNLAHVTLTGRVSEPATLTIDGVALQVQADLTFTTSVLSLSEGSNVFHLVATDPTGNVGTLDAAVTRDSTGPELAITSPASGTACGGGQTFAFTWSDTGSGVDPASLQVRANGAAISMSCQSSASGATCTPGPLPPGSVSISAVVADLAGNSSLQATALCSVDPGLAPPVIAVVSPSAGSVVNATEISIRGSLSKQATLTINAQPVAVAADLSFEAGPYVLVEGLNSFSLDAADGSGQSGHLPLTVTRDSTAPGAVNASLMTATEAAPGSQSVTGAPGAVTNSEPGLVVVIRNLATGIARPAAVNGDGSFAQSVLAIGGDALRVTVQDPAGNTSSPVEITVSGTTPVPADPAAVAPALSRSDAVDTCGLVGFFWKGSQPVQYGVRANAVDCDRLAVVHGRILDATGAPVAGVRILPLGEPDYGETFTRADGAFDFAVRASSRLVLSVTRSGFVPVLRTLEIVPDQFLTLDDVVLTQVDAQVTPIDASGAASTPQVARGSVITDVLGTRQATMIFPAGLQATTVSAEGVSQPLPVLRVRATDFRVQGDTVSAPDVAPSGIVPSYAMELSVDGVDLTGGARVEFDRPVAFYVENFLGAATGASVDVYALDRSTAVWGREESGRILKVLSITSGLADLDLTGGGTPASATDLQALGIDDAERAQLATLYAPGQSLCRLAVRHFSARYTGWFSQQDGHASSLVLIAPVVGDDNRVDQATVESFGGSIEVENQILGQSLPIAGTPMSLVYSSDRVPGRTAAYKMRVHLIGPLTEIASYFSRVDLDIDVAGNHFKQSFAPQVNLSYDYTWDGRDGFGRLLPGAAKWTVRIAYVYRYAGPTGTKALVRTFAGTIGSFDAAGAMGLGGWTISSNHFYDRPHGTLYYGDGRRRALNSVSNTTNVIERVAGNGDYNTGGDSGPARDAPLEAPLGLSVMHDGSVLIADYDACRIRKVSVSDGTITTIAGTTCGRGDLGEGDGGSALLAQFSHPVKAVEGKDGNIYVADRTGHRIRAIDVETGIISTAAGSGVPGCGENQLSYPNDIAAMADGGLLIANQGQMAPYPDMSYTCSSIQKLTPIKGHPGLLEDLVGKAVSVRQAWDWSSIQPSGVAEGPDGGVYFTPVSAIAKRPPGGGDDGRPMPWIVAGLPQFYRAGATVFRGDGAPASADVTRFFGPQHLAVGADGTIYVADEDNQRIRAIDPGGVVNTLVGGGDIRLDGDGVAAKSAFVGDPFGVALDPVHNILYFSDAAHHQVFRMHLAKPQLPNRIAERDGSLVYTFDEEGHHLTTEDAVTGTALETFEYTNFLQPDGSARHLVTSIKDQFGNTTTIQRAANGDASAIVAPLGQQTVLQLDGNGYMSQVTGGGATVKPTHDALGLLRTLIDPRSHSYGFDYDPDGRLKHVSDPVGGTLDLARSELHSGWQVTQTTGMGRTSSVKVELPSSDGTTDPNDPDSLGPYDARGRFFVDAANLKSSVIETRTRLIRNSSPTGMYGEVQLGANPHLPDLAEFPSSIATQTPAGLTPIVRKTLDASAWTFTSKLNSEAAAKSSYVPGVLTSTSPAGRQATAILDGLGNITSSRIADLDAVEVRYDAKGRPSHVGLGPFGAVRPVDYSYDTNGYLHTVTDVLGHVVQFVNDPVSGRTTTEILPDLRQVGFSYDTNGNLQSLTPPSRPAHTFDYSEVDQVATYTPPPVVVGRSDATSYAYNLDHQVELVTRPDGQTIDPAYDTAGRLGTITTPDGVTTYHYDPATGSLTGIDAPAGGGAIGFGFDGSLLKGVQQTGAVSGTVAYTYDQGLRVTSQTINGSAIDYQYDADGELTVAGPLQLFPHPSTGLLTGTSLLNSGDAYQRNSRGEVIDYRAGLNDGTCKVGPSPFVGCVTIYEETPTRDLLGRIAERTETVTDPVWGAPESHGYTYTFDDAGRLTDVLRDGAAWEHFHYDGNSNRDSWIDPWGSGTATYDDQDRLLTYGPYTYTYTVNGELQTKSQGSQTTRYTYDVLGNLRSVQLPDGVVIDYVIDAANRRIGKKINGTLVRGFVYGAGGAPVALLDGSNAVVATFVYGDGGNVPTAMISGGTTYRIITDHLGSVQLVIDAVTGAVAERIDYDVFGRVVQDTNPGFQPFGFAGGLYDYQTGLVRFGARDYDAESGRWTAKDPIGFQGGDSNQYAYVGGDPVNGRDPSGLADCEEDWYLVGQKGSGGASVGECTPTLESLAEGWLDSISGTPSSTAMGPGSSHTVGEFRTFSLIGIAAGALDAAVASASALADEIAAVEPGSFSIRDWTGYPSGVPRPQGPFRLLEGQEYESARDAADAANAALRRQQGLVGQPVDVHEIQPVKFGGSPTDMANKVVLQRSLHRQLVTPWWNQLLRDLTGP